MLSVIPVATTNAPPAAASYSHAVKANNFIYISGQTPYTPEGKRIEGSISDKADQVIRNIRGILEDAGSSIDKIVKVNVFLGDMDDFDEFNAVYANYFHTHQPARSCIAVKDLPWGVDLEIEAIAVQN